MAAASEYRHNHNPRRLNVCMMKHGLFVAIAIKYWLAAFPFLSYRFRIHIEDHMRNTRYRGGATQISAVIRIRL